MLRDLLHYCNHMYFNLDLPEQVSQVLKHFSFSSLHIPCWKEQSATVKYMKSVLNHFYLKIRDNYFNISTVLKHVTYIVFVIFSLSAIQVLEKSVSIYFVWEITLINTFQMYNQEVSLLFIEAFKAMLFKWKDSLLL